MSSDSINVSSSHSVGQSLQTKAPVVKSTTHEGGQSGTGTSHTSQSPPSVTVNLSAEAQALSTTSGNRSSHS